MENIHNSVTFQMQLTVWLWRDTMWCATNIETKPFFHMFLLHRQKWPNRLKFDNNRKNDNRIDYHVAYFFSFGCYGSVCLAYIRNSLLLLFLYRQHKQIQTKAATTTITHISNEHSFFLLRFTFQLWGIRSTIYANVAYAFACFVLLFSLFSLIWFSVYQLSVDLRVLSRIQTLGQSATLHAFPFILMKWTQQR